MVSSDSERDLFEQAKHAGRGREEMKIDNIYITIREITRILPPDTSK